LNYTLISDTVCTVHCIVIQASLVVIRSVKQVTFIRAEICHQSSFGCCCF